MRKTEEVTKRIKNVRNLGKLEEIVERANEKGVVLTLPYAQAVALKRSSLLSLDPLVGAAVRAAARERKLERRVQRREKACLRTGSPRYEAYSYLMEGMMAPIFAFSEGVSDGRYTFSSFAELSEFCEQEFGKPLTKAKYEDSLKLIARIIAREPQVEAQGLVMKVLKCCGFLDHSSKVELAYKAMMVVDHAMSAGGAFKQAVTAFKEHKFGQALTLLMDMIQEGFMIGIAVLEGAWIVVGALVGKIIQKIWQFGKEVIESVIQFIKRVISLVSEKADKAKEASEKLPAIFEQVGNDLKEKAEAAGVGIKSAAADVKNGVQATFKKAEDSVKAKVENSEGLKVFPKFFESFKKRFEHEPVVDAQSNILFDLVSVVRMTIAGWEPEQSSELRETVARLNALAVLPVNVGKAINWLKEFFAGIVDAICMLFTGHAYYEDEADKISRMETAWRKEAVELRKKLKPGCASDIVEDGKRLDEQYVQLCEQYVEKKVKRDMQVRAVSDLVFRQLKDALTPLLYTAGEGHAEPVLVLFHSAPSMGKSNAMQICASAMSKIMGWKDPVQFDPAAEFHDDYNENECIYHDELFAQTDKNVRAREAEVVLRLGAPNASKVNKAFDKSTTKQVAQIGFFTTNLGQNWASLGMTSPAAVLRRFDCFEVTLQDPEKGFGFRDAEKDPDLVWHFKLNDRIQILTESKMIGNPEQVAGLTNFHKRTLASARKLGINIHNKLVMSEVLMLLRENVQLSTEWENESKKASEVLRKRIQAETVRKYTEKVVENVTAPSIDLPSVHRRKRAVLLDSSEEEVVKVEEDEKVEAQGFITRTGQVDNPTWAVLLSEFLSMFTQGERARHKAHMQVCRSVLGDGEVMTDEEVLLALEERGITVLTPARALLMIVKSVMEGVAVAFVGAGIGVGVTLLVRSLTKTAEVEGQAYQEEAHKLMKRRLPNVTVVSQVASENLKGMLGVVSKQMFSVKIIRSDCALSAQAIGICDRNLLTVHHAFYDPDKIEAIVLSGVGLKDHVIRKDDPRGRMWTVKTIRPEGQEPEDVVDCAVITFDRRVPMPPIRKIIDYFPSQDNAYMHDLVNLRKVSVQDGIVTIEDLPSAKTVGGGIRSRWADTTERRTVGVMKYDAKTSAGDSGSLLVVDDNSTPTKCIGLHIAIGEHNGWGTFICREWLELMVETSIAVEAQAGIFSVPQLESGEPPVYLANYQVLGKLPKDYKVHLPSKTKIVPSVIAGELVGQLKQDMMPATLTPVGEWSPFEEACKRTRKEAVDDVAITLNTVLFVVMAAQIGKPVVGADHDCFLSMSEVLNGIPGKFKGMRKTASIGWPANVGQARKDGMSKKAHLVVELDGEVLPLQELNEAWQKFCEAAEGRGEVPPKLCSLNLKEELRPVVDTEDAGLELMCARGGKIDAQMRKAAWVVLPSGRIQRPKKTRGFYANSAYDYVIEARVLGNFAMAMAANHANNGIGVGFNPDSVSCVKTLCMNLRKIDGGQYTVSIDLSNNDVRSGLFSGFVWDVVEAWYQLHYGARFTESHRMKLRLCRARDRTRVIAIGEWLCANASIFDSGKYATTELNSLVTKGVMLRSTQKALAAKNVHCSLVELLSETAMETCGDDTVLAVPEKYAKVVTPQDIAESGRTLGVEISSAYDKDTYGLGNWTNYKNLNWIKRTLRFEGGVPFFPLDKRTIEGTLFWQKSKGDSKVLCAQNCCSSLRHAMHWGEEYFAWLQKILIEACARTGVELPALTYAQLKNEYMQQ